MTVHEIGLLDLPRLANVGQREDLDGVRKFTNTKNGNIAEYLSASIPFTDTIGVYGRESDEIALGLSLDKQRSYANLSFIAPTSSLSSNITQRALEYILELAGERGMISVCAETSSDEIATVLRSAGFSFYYTQQVWQIETTYKNKPENTWTLTNEEDRTSVRHLYSQVTPPMIQFLQPFPPKGAKIYRLVNGNAYCVVWTGMSGIMILPYFLPDEPNSEAKLAELINSIRINMDQKIYLLSRSTMNWVEPIISSLGARRIEQQQVMLKRLANPISHQESLKNARQQDARMLPTSIKEGQTARVDQGIEQIRTK